MGYRKPIMECEDLEVLASQPCTDGQSAGPEEGGGALALPVSAAALWIEPKEEDFWSDKANASGFNDGLQWAADVFCINLKHILERKSVEEKVVLFKNLISFEVKNVPYADKCRYSAAMVIGLTVALEVFQEFAVKNFLVS